MAWFVQGEYKDRDQGVFLSPDIVRIEREHARFEEAAKKLNQQIEQKWMTGDRNMDSIDYPDYLSLKLPYLNDGWRFPPFDTPLHDQLKYKEKSIVDIVGTSFGAYAISQRVVDFIEDIEPGVHQFIPYRMLNRDGSIRPERRWLLNICTRAEVIDVEKSNVAWTDVGGGRRKFGDITAGGNEPHIVVKAEEASQRSTWCEWRYHSGRYPIISDRFWNALHAAGINSWRPHYDYSDHVEEV